MKFFNFFSPHQCVDAQCDTDAAAQAPCVTPAAAEAAESLSEYIRLIHARPQLPPAPQGARPEQRLRTYHPIPQRADGDVVIVNGLPCGLREIGYAVYMATRGGVTAADVTEARAISGRMPHNHPQKAFIPSGYQLPAAARAVLGDDLQGALTAAAAVYYVSHDFVDALSDRRARAEKYGAVTPIAAGVIINGGAPDNQAHGAIPLTEAEEKLLKKWLKIRDSDAWLEPSEALNARQAAWDAASEARRKAETALAAWKTKVRLHPMRAAFKFDV